MKYFILSIIMCSLMCICHAQTSSKFTDTTLLQPIELTVVRATDKTPVAKTNLSASDIEKNNTGQDLPFILNQTPSVIINSDAGNGIGYTGIRIRGADASRINVSLNGIPYNDAESQATFFVDLPDIASSAGSIQIQRGVGTSVNGAGAFGGTINISTNDVETKKSLAFDNSSGSYHSFKNTLKLNSGLLSKHFIVSARLSKIRSDGYIERAYSRLKSFYTSAAYIDEKNSLRLNIFSGKEKTYQAWNGIDESTLLMNRRYNISGTEKAGEPYNNQIDNYTQTHYQLFYNHKFNAYWKVSVAGFFTHGKGYYEVYDSAQALSNYGLPDYNDDGSIITQTDMIRRLWLDNNFYGSIFSFQYEKNKTNIIAGGSWNNYDGKHFGEITWTKVAHAAPTNYRWYDLTAYKKDYSAYYKWTQKINKNWQTFVDLQVRKIDYKINGFQDSPALQVDNNYFFFNPKAGLTYTKNKMQWYISYGRAAKEPNRDDFEAGMGQQPKPETLNDFESGISYRNKKYFIGINLYFMNYNNQLILTGKINDVGAYTRTNILKSYRAGIEAEGSGKLYSWLSINANVTLSENKINNFTEFIDDYDNGDQQTKFYPKTDIAFSPDIISSLVIYFIPLKHAEISLISKYVSRQYLDNTSHHSRMLKAYYVQDARVSYEWQWKKANQGSMKFFVQVNNLFSKKYEPNGYSFSYFYGGELTTENYYFPMAPVNLMAGLNVRL